MRIIVIYIATHIPRCKLDIDMRQGIILLAGLLATLPVFSQLQVNGIVLHEKTRAPLPFVNIVIKETHQGIASDIDGRFSMVCRPGHTLEFRYVGFESVQLVPIRSGPVTIYLKEKPTELDAIVIRPGDNPALRIMRRVIANREQNDPENLESFTYNTYNKLSCAIQPVGNLSRTGKDSVRLKKFVNNNLAFVSESYTEKKYERHNRHKEIVLGNRFSGIKDPFFAFLATDFQPFGFYKEVIPLMGVNYLNPISPGSLERYDYTVMDTVYHDPDSIYIIDFEPLPGKSFEGLQGQLYISTDGYAIEHVLARPADEHLLMESRIQQKYEKRDGHWFPVMLNSELIFNNYQVRNLRPYYYSRSYLSNIRIGAKVDEKEFDLLHVSFDPNANSQLEEFWNARRTDSLSRKEKNTYKMYDSVSSKLKAFNTMLKLAEGFLVGRLKLGSFYVPTETLLRFNQYEGVRIGFGLQTGESISKLFSVEAYGAYGFNDKATKYGGAFRLNILPQKEAYLRVSYQQDVSEPGNSDFIRGPALNGGESFRRWLTARMDSIRQIRAEFSFRPFPFSQLQIFLQEQRRNPAYPYQYLSPSDPTTIRNEFISSSIGIQWRYAFRESYTQIGNSKIVTNNANPQINVAVSSSIPGLLDGQYDFTKVEARFDHHKIWASGGTTTYQLTGGYSWGQIPYPFLYNAKGTLYDNTLSQGVYIGNYFQTMGLYEFVSDQYAYLFLQHNFGRLTGTKSEYFRPELTLVQNTGWGSLKNPEAHQQIKFKTMEKGYFESGLMLTNILRFRYLNILHYGLGGGVFYRYGPNALASSNNNVAWKLFVTVSF